VTRHALANPRVPADQNHRTGHAPPANDAVELADAGGDAAVVVEADGVDRLRPLAGGDERRARRPGGRARVRHHFLGEAVPAATGRARSPRHAPRTRMQTHGASGGRSTTHPVSPAWSRTPARPSSPASSISTETTTAAPSGLRNDHEAGTRAEPDPRLPVAF